MGILNVTDDSFFDGGRFLDNDAISKQAEKLITNGADIIDIGGYSSRPGARDIDADLEFERLKTGLEIVRSISETIPVSIDTFRSEVAKKCLDLGANMINDISAGELDPDMYSIIAKYQVPYIIMHMAGTPQNMMGNTRYDDILVDLLNYFAKKLELLTQIGIKDVIIDVGFGFSKTTSQNHQILHYLQLFEMLNAPILAGISRKSMIYKVLKTSPAEALNGTSVLNTIALLNGVSVVRVHDVKEAKEVIELLNYKDN